MSNIRQAVPGQFFIGVEEEFPLTVDVTNWADAPTAACTVIKLSGTDVSASHLSSSGSATAISGASITTPCFINLIDSNDYRVEVKFEQAGKIYETFFFVTGGS